MCERVLGIVVHIELCELLERHFVLHHDGAEDTTGEVATIGYKVDGSLETALQLLQRLAYLGQVLVAEGFVDAHVVVAPAEVGHRRRLAASARATDDGVHINVIVEHEVLGQGQQAEGDAGGKVTRVGHEAALADGTAVQLGQSIDKLIILSLEAVATREVDDLQLLGYLVRLHKLTALLDIGTEEEEVYLIQFGLVGKGKLGLTIESAMHLMYLLAAVATTCNEYQVYIRVIEQQTYEFTTGKPSAFNDSSFYHSFINVFISGMMRSS